MEKAECGSGTAAGQAGSALVIWDTKWPCGQSCGVVGHQVSLWAELCCCGTPNGDVCIALLM